MIIAFVNHSTLITNEQVDTWAAACAKQMAEDVLPKWRAHLETQGVLAIGEKVIVNSWPDDACVPDKAFVIRLLDVGPMLGAAGAHGVDGGFIDVGACLAAGIPVSGCMSHEDIETLCNRLLSIWRTDTRNGLRWPQEPCDAIEGDRYLKDGVEVSNFCLPEFYDANSKGKVDFMGILSGPFTLDVSTGGYSPIMKPDGTVETWPLGAELRTWKTNPHSRTAKLLATKEPS